jgi:L-glyceraldehyde 3-phosphate reductase
MGALADAVKQGKALYIGISSYSVERTAQAVKVLEQMGVPLLIHQPNYSMFNRWLERGLLDVLGDAGVGCIAFSPLAQGLLTDRYVDSIPQGSRITQDKSLPPDLLTDEVRHRIKGLHALARDRGQSLAQMAIAWALRDSRVTSALIGASSVRQLEENVAALTSSAFSAEELSRIDEFAVDSGVDLWETSTKV